MEDLFKTWTAWVALGVEGAAALIIALAALEATWQALRVFLSRPSLLDAAKESVRLRLARWLAVALEFALAAVSCGRPLRRAGTRTASWRSSRHFGPC